MTSPLVDSNSCMPLSSSSLELLLLPHRQKLRHFLPQISWAAPRAPKWYRTSRDYPLPKITWLHNKARLYSCSQPVHVSVKTLSSINLFASYINSSVYFLVLVPQGRCTSFKSSQLGDSWSADQQVPWEQVPRRSPQASKNDLCLGSEGFIWQSDGHFPPGTSQCTNLGPDWPKKSTCQC